MSAVSLRCLYTIDDYKQAYRTHFKRGASGGVRALRLLDLLMGGFLMLIGAANAFVNPSSFAGYIPPLLVGAGVIAWRPMMIRWQAKRSCRNSPSLREEYVIEIDDTGVHCSNGLARMEWRWPAFVRVIEGSAVWLLYYSACAFCILPKRILVGPEGQAAVELIRRNDPAHMQAAASAA